MVKSSDPLICCTLPDNIIDVDIIIFFHEEWVDRLVAMHVTKEVV